MITYVDLRKIYFDGGTYDELLDQHRLTCQLFRVFALMMDGRWRTLAEIEKVVGPSQAGISARLRDFRKDRFGAHHVARRRRSPNCWEYQLQVNEHETYYTFFATADA